MKRSVGIVGLMGMVLLIVSFSGLSLAHAAGLGVKWGLLPPLTGPFATMGKQQMQGSVLALEELKATGGGFEDLSGLWRTRPSNRLLPSKRRRS